MSCLSTYKGCVEVGTEKGWETLNYKERATKLRDLKVDFGKSDMYDPVKNGIVSIIFSGHYGILQ